MNEKKIFVAADHAGFSMKKDVVNFLKSKKYKVKDLGPFEFDENDDYPDYAYPLCKEVLKNDDLGILICGTGQGMDRVANKVNGIDAAVVWDEFSANVAKEHGNVNVLCFGARSVSLEMAKKMLKIWLETPFPNGERHRRRINKIREIERLN